MNISWLQDYKESTIQGTAHLWTERGGMDKKLFAEAAIAHPVIAFRMIRRFAKQFPLIVENLNGIDADLGN